MPEVDALFGDETVSNTISPAAPIQSPAGLQPAG